MIDVADLGEHLPVAQRGHDHANRQHPPLLNGGGRWPDSSCRDDRALRVSVTPRTCCGCPNDADRRCPGLRRLAVGMSRASWCQRKEHLVERRPPQRDVQQLDVRRVQLVQGLREGVRAVGAGIAMRSDAVVKAARCAPATSDPSACAMAGRSVRCRGTISQICRSGALLELVGRALGDDRARGRSR